MLFFVVMLVLGVVEIIWGVCVFVFCIVLMILMFLLVLFNGVEGWKNFFWFVCFGIVFFVIVCFV